MRDFIDFETTPYDEPSALLGAKQYDYRATAMMEYFAMRDQLLRQFGTPPPSISMRKHNNHHDFGVYLSLRVYFDDEDRESERWAYRIEEEWPAKWDEKAVEHLKSNGYQLIGEQVR